MLSYDDTPLGTAPGWKKAYVDRLTPIAITSLEQVVGMGASAQGRKALAEQLGVSDQEMAKLLDSARATIPPSVAAELSQEADTRRFGLGALPPTA
jgi:hypothetical protein